MISVFLPWASVDFAFGRTATAAGTEMGWGILSLIMGFIAVAVAFLPMLRIEVPRIEGFVHVAAGALAAIGVAAYWGALEAHFGIARGLMDVSPGIGLILCLIAAAAVIVIGILELRQKGMPSA